MNKKRAESRLRPVLIASFHELASKNDLGEFVRTVVQDVLNGRLNEEANGSIGAERHESTVD